MKAVAKTLLLNKIEYYITHLSIINCLLPIKMTSTEIKILAWFMSFSGELGNDRFSATGRKIIRSKLGLTHQGLSNFMHSLLEKKFLLEKDGKLSILQILHPEPDEQTYMIKLKNIDI